MDFEKYFRFELSLLRKRAEENPHLAQLLSEHTADKDAGYVLESFALLGASIRAYLEEPYTELSEALLQRLMPEMLKPFPSFTTLSFSSNDKSFVKPLDIERGMECTSQPLVTRNTTAPMSHQPQDEPIPDSDLRCYFRTSRSTTLLPFVLEHTELDNSLVRAEITLHFRTNRPLTLQQLHLEMLRLCLAHSPETGKMLYLWFRFHFRGGELRVNDEIIPLKRIFFKSVGFERDETLLPWSDTISMGHRILLEYFLYPEGFLYIDLMNLPELPEEIQCEQFSLCLHFARPLPPDIVLDQQTIQLFCTPAVNRFTRSSEIIAPQETADALPLLPRETRENHLEIYSVDQVMSWTGEKAHANYHYYPPFEMSGTWVEQGSEERTVYYLIEGRRELFSDHVEHTLSFVYGDKQPAIVKDENIRATLTCTNLELPLQLDVGDINEPGKGIPLPVSVRNISRPTAPLPPLRDGITLWEMVSNLALNYLSLLSKEALQETLRPYNLRAKHEPHLAREFERRLAGIHRFETDVWDWIFEGVPVRGMESDLYLSAENGAFTSEGDLYLFGTVLSHFFAVYASVNSYHRLKLHDLDTGGFYQWRVKRGQRALI